jgi:hypothetical protein
MVPGCDSPPDLGTPLGREGRGSAYWWATYGRIRSMKNLKAVSMVVAAFLIAGCSEQSNAPKKAQVGNQKPKTVVVNEGMSKEEEEKLNQRLADLEE